MKHIIPTALLAAAAFAASAAALSQPQPRFLWTFAGPANPAYERVTLAAAGNGFVYAVVTGKSWTFTTENGTFTETGSAAAAVDAATGKLKWSADSRWPILSPLLFSGGRVIAHNGYGEVLCLEAAAGRVLWKAERELHPGSWDERTMPSAQGEFLFLREEASIVCRSLQDGKPVWSTPISAVQNRRVFPALAGDRVIVATAMDDVVGLNAADGRVAWKKKIGWLEDISVVGPGIALAANADRLYAFSTADGKDMWILEKASPLAIKEDLVYLLEKQGEEIVCRDLATARRKSWSMPTASDFQGFSVAGPLVLIVQSGRLIARQAADGKIVWEFTIPGETALKGQALAVDGKIYVAGAKGLHALDAGDPLVTGWPQSAGGALRSGAGR